MRDLGPGTTHRGDSGSLFQLRDCKLEITIEDGYLKAYATPNDGAGILSYGLQGRVRDEILLAAGELVDEYLEAQRA